MGFQVTSRIFLLGSFLPPCSIVISGVTSFLWILKVFSRFSFFFFWALRFPSSGLLGWLVSGRFSGILWVLLFPLGCPISSGFSGGLQVFPQGSPVTSMFSDFLCVLRFSVASHVSSGFCNFLQVLGFPRVSLVFTRFSVFLWVLLFPLGSLMFLSKFLLVVTLLPANLLLNWPLERMYVRI